MIKHPHSLTRVGLKPFVLSLSVLVLAGFAFGTSKLSLSVAGGPPTTRVIVSGSGFAAHSTVDIYFDTRDQSVAMTDGSGAFWRVAIQVPPSALPGKHWVSVVERSSRAGSQVSFTVQSDWTEFLKQNMRRWNGVENLLSVSSVKNLQLKWSYLTNSDVETAPIVANGVVYVGSYTYGVYALDTSSGALKWSYPMTTILSSPAVSNGVLYIGSDDGNLYALDASSGALQWKYLTGSKVHSSPTVANGTVYFGSDDGNVYALNASTGALLWSYNTPGAVSSAPAVVNGVVYAGSQGAAVYALNGGTGAFLWSFATTQQVFSSPLVANGMRYVCDGNQTLYALSASTGGKLWTKGYACDNAPSLALANGTLYVATDGGKLYALNATTGAVRWSYLAPHSVFYSAPAVANGVVYISPDGLGALALNASTGVKLWSYGDLFFHSSSPTVANGMLFVGDDNGILYAFGLPNKPRGAEASERAPSLRALTPDLSLRK